MGADVVDFEAIDMRSYGNGGHSGWNSLQTPSILPSLAFYQVLYSTKECTTCEQSPSLLRLETNNAHFDPSVAQARPKYLAAYAMFMHVVTILRHLMQAFHYAENAACPFWIEDAS